MKRIIVIIIAVCVLALSGSLLLPADMLRQVLSGVVGVYMGSRGLERVEKTAGDEPLRYWRSVPMQPNNVAASEATANSVREAVVLLHGAGGDEVSTWFRLMPALSDTYTVYAPHLAYADLAASASQLVHFRREQEALLALLDAEGLDKVHLVGMSAGAWMAGLFATVHPKRVRSLVMISPMGTANETIIEPLLEGELSGREFAQKIFHHPPPFLSLYADALGNEVERSLDALRVYYHRSVIREMDMAKRGGRIRGPALILWGEHDAIVPRAVPESLARLLRKAHLRVVPDSGHAMVWDAPHELEASIRQFLSAAR